MNEQTALEIRAAKRLYKSALCQPSQFTPDALKRAATKVEQAAKSDPCPLAQYRAAQLIQKFETFTNKNK
jgi:hypothetical protein